MNNINQDEIRKLSLEQALIRYIAQAWKDVRLGSIPENDSVVLETQSIDGVTVHRKAEYSILIFTVDREFSELAESRVREIIRFLRAQFTDCKKYSFSIEECEDSLQFKIKLFLI